MNNIKRSSVAIMAAAMLAAAPITDMFPLPLGITVGAAENEYKEGDVFDAELDNNAVLTGSFNEDLDETPYLLSYRCTVKADGTLKIDFIFNCPAEDCFPAAFMGKTVAIPDEINGCTVTEIGNCIDLGCTKLIIPDSVTEIGYMAFSFDPFLTEIEFGENSQLRLIGKYAFSECRSLKSVTIPASVETVAFGAFMVGDDGSVRGLYVDADSKAKEYDFSDEYSLTSVEFAEGSKLTELEEGAFQCQRALSSVTLPDSLEKIGYGVFMGCLDLTEITIPANVSEIGTVAFAASPDNLPMKLSAINVHENNEHFRSVDGVLFSKDGKTLVAYPPAKSGSYEIPEGVCEISEAAFQGARLTSVSIPEGVTDIASNAFTICKDLAEVRLPNTLRSIGKWGFEGCAFTSVDIPESVTDIDPQAFESSALKNINGTPGSYAQSFAQENGYTFNGKNADDTAETSDTDRGDNPQTGNTSAGAAACTLLLAGTVMLAAKKRKG